MNTKALWLLVGIILTSWTATANAQRPTGKVALTVQADLNALRDAFLASGHTEEEWTLHSPRFRYIWIPPGDPEMIAAYDATLKFLINSFSSQHVIERALPVRISQDMLLYRIDLVELKWRWQDLVDGLPSFGRPYFYGGGKNPLIIRGDYFINTICDEVASNLGPLLFFNGKIPKTDDEFAAFLGFNTDEQAAHNFGLIEENSGVSVNKVRWILYYDAPFGYWWETYDYERLTLDNHPLETLDPQNPNADASEIIVGFQKISTVNSRSGNSQLYMLLDKKQRRIPEASGRVVTDHSSFKSTDLIRNSGSCMQCHPGINIPHRDAVQKLIADGTEVWGTEKRRDDIERFHFSDIGKLIKRNNEDYATFVFLVNGLDPTANVQAFKTCIAAYEQDVGLIQAAIELECTPIDLQRAIAFTSQRKIKIGTNLAKLTAGKEKIPRSIWEELHHGTAVMVETWRKANSEPIPATVK